MKTLTPRQINAQRKKNGQPPLNFRLIRRIIQKIETTPESYDQGIWGRREAKAPCGTAACIAGWASFLAGKKTAEQLRRNPKSVRNIGAAVLGLDTKNDYLWEVGMFSGDADGWPEPFRRRYQNAPGPRSRARVAVAYLKHVLKTGQVVES